MSPVNLYPINFFQFQGSHLSPTLNPSPPRQLLFHLVIRFYFVGSVWKLKKCLYLCLRTEKQLLI